jgi:hypothetical protein
MFKSETLEVVLWYAAQRKPQRGVEKKAIPLHNPLFHYIELHSIDL